ncbi:MAG: bifunctional diaminohydroxyphosphoribosylaminopyrimidine deaminase/5-amino-6-(5-phosphoribosylamino)uracil reductase RibD [Planctomycetes bacterium]|nr:bifunctional diaminohydroxyphosphoribosylaminopyrimidine deaminase/5-amino-6-(5-phosphoribosylamino)uracil reductase RibD [Planctomycetota bacterium]
MATPENPWMRRALALAERGRGHVEPNPLVGAVVVRDEIVVGEGWHAKFGEAHAEINALMQAGEAARGSTVYVTLEPCCHHGKTPPCTEALVRAGVARVVAALEDPFPKVAGQGAAQLRAAGIPIEFGVGAESARRQNAPYFKLLAAGRPYVHAKWAMSLDGKIATRSGDSRWISNEASRRRVHDLRGRMDAIVVGIGTALADDPLLTARPAGPRMPTRVVLDSTGRLPLASQLVRTAREIPTLIVTSHPAPKLIEAGCEVLTVPGERGGKPDVLQMLTDFGQRRWTNLLVEGGAGVLGAFFDARSVDEVHLFVAPKLIGGAGAKTPVAGLGIDVIADGTVWVTEAIENLDGDVYMRCHTKI